MSGKLKRKDLRKAIKRLEKQLGRLQSGVDQLVRQAAPAKPAKPLNVAKPAVTPTVEAQPLVKKAPVKKTPAKKAPVKKASAPPAGPS